MLPSDSLKLQHQIKSHLAANNSGLYRDLKLFLDKPIYLDTCVMNYGWQKNTAGLKGFCTVVKEIRITICSKVSVLICVTFFLPIDMKICQTPLTSKKLNNLFHSCSWKGEEVFQQEDCQNVSPSLFPNKSKLHCRLSHSHHRLIIMATWPTRTNGPTAGYFPVAEWFHSQMEQLMWQWRVTQADDTNLVDVLFSRSDAHQMSEITLQFYTGW
jgi:hypothetical protein